MKGRVEAGEVWEVGSALLLLIRDEKSVLKNVILAGGCRVGGVSGEELKDWIKSNGRFITNLAQIVEETGL